MWLEQVDLALSATGAGMIGDEFTWNIYIYGIHVHDTVMMQ